MKNLFLSFLLLFGSHLILLAQSGPSGKFTKPEDSLFMVQLKQLPGVVDVSSQPVTDYYMGKYKITFRQPLDHDHPGKGNFEQRVFLLHKGFDKPVVVTTEGYAANYGEIQFYQNELNQIVDGNEVLIEHRFFSESTPAPVNWDYLTVEDAAADHHQIIKAFKMLYDNKWISTGISKGGQTVLYHQALYPDDVDMAIPYVAPLNYAVEDGRHEAFIEKNGRKKDQKAVCNFQMEVLKRREALIPLFEKYIKAKAYTFRIPIEEVFDYCVLEYSFAFWQWVADTESIPQEDASDQEIFKHFIRVSGPAYFSREDGVGLMPFFVQAARELGYYGYDTETFQDYLVIPDAEGYMYEVFLPDSLANLPFIPETNQKVFSYLKNNDPKMILIYGEYDPWSASGVFFKGKKHMTKIIKKGGHHGTRIGNLPEKQKEKVIQQIEEWLAE